LVAQLAENLYFLKNLSNTSYVANRFFHRHSLVICSDRARQYDDTVLDSNINTRKFDSRVPLKYVEDFPPNLTISHRYPPTKLGSVGHHREPHGNLPISVRRPTAIHGHCDTCY
jgi:hypothetical protein